MDGASKSVTSSECNEWTCEACTYLHTNPSYLACTVCQTQRRPGNTEEEDSGEEPPIRMHGTKRKLEGSTKPSPCVSPCIQSTGERAMTSPRIGREDGNEEAGHSGVERENTRTHTSDTYATSSRQVPDHDCVSLVERAVTARGHCAWCDTAIAKGEPRVADITHACLLLHTPALTHARS
jgi:hypothetical protein